MCKHHTYEHVPGCLKCKHHDCGHALGMSERLSQRSELNSRTYTESVPRLQTAGRQQPYTSGGGNWTPQGMCFKRKHHTYERVPGRLKCKHHHNGHLPGVSKRIPQRSELYSCSNCTAKHQWVTKQARRSVQATHIEFICNTQSRITNGDGLSGPNEAFEIAHTVR